MIDRGREWGKALLCVTTGLVEELSDPFLSVALEAALGLSARLVPALHVSSVRFRDLQFAVHSNADGVCAKAQEHDGDSAALRRKFPELREIARTARRDGKRRREGEKNLRSGNDHEAGLISTNVFRQPGKVREV